MLKDTAKSGGAIRTESALRLPSLIVRNRYYLMMIAPVVAYFVVFHYLPMYGVLIAFKDFSPMKGILRSPWAGLKWFRQLFSSIYLGRAIRNTLLINGYSILFGFPVPIVFALLLNEIRSERLKRTVQTVSYLPHFISVVVVVGMLGMFLSPSDGPVNALLRRLGRAPIAFLQEPSWFRPIFIASGVWQQFGWSSIIYLAALATIDPDLYEACVIDGGNRFQQMVSITLPGLLPTIVILLILRVGHIMSLGFQKILLMYNPLTYSVADVISTYIYRIGILQAQYSIGAAMGLFNSAVNFLVLISVNRISRRVTDIALW